MRRLENVSGQFSLIALACHMRHAINFVGVPTLVEAARLSTERHRPDLALESSSRGPSPGIEPGIRVVPRRLQSTRGSHKLDGDRITCEEHGSCIP